MKMGDGSILSAGLIVAVGMFGLIGWISVAVTALTGYAQGRRARLIGTQAFAYIVVAVGLWVVQQGAPDLVFFLYLHAAAVSAVDLLLVRWFRWRLWAGVRFERRA